MRGELEHLDLIDLLSERHIMLRKITEKLWNDNSDIPISNSEWFIMARIYKKQPTIASVAKNVEITRQATHKFVKQLEAKGLVQVMNAKHNNKAKCIQLTPLGEQCYEKNAILKQKLIQHIAEHIGEEKVHILMEILNLDWGLEEKKLVDNH